MTTEFCATVADAHFDRCWIKYTSGFFGYHVWSPRGKAIELPTLQSFLRCHVMQIRSYSITCIPQRKGTYHPSWIPYLHSQNKLLNTVFTLFSLRKSASSLLEAWSSKSNNKYKRNAPSDELYISERYVLKRPWTTIDGSIRTGTIPRCDNRPAAAVRQTMQSWRSRLTKIEGSS